MGTAVVLLDGRQVGTVTLVTDRKYASALLKGGVQALLLIPVVLLAVAVLSLITARLGHSPVHFSVLGRRSHRAKARRRR